MRKPRRNGGRIASGRETGNRMTDISGVDPDYSGVVSQPVEGMRLDWVSCVTWMGAALLSAGFWTLVVSTVA